MEVNTGTPNVPTRPVPNVETEDTHGIYVHDYPQVTDLLVTPMTVEVLKGQLKVTIRVREKGKEHPGQQVEDKPNQTVAGLVAIPTIGKGIVHAYRPKPTRDAVSLQGSKFVRPYHCHHPQS